MKWLSVAGLAAVLLASAPMCRPDETITVTLDGTSNKSAAGAKKSSPAASKTLPGKTFAQSALKADFQAIGRLGVVSIGPSRIRSARRDDAQFYFECPKGTYLAITSEAEGWYGVLMSDGRTGWVRKDGVSLLDYDVVRGSMGSTQAQRIIQTAFKYLGVPYRWGGNTASGIDCSGFVKKVFGAHGISLPRTAREQATIGAPVQGNQLKPGDRLYFSCEHRMIDHTGIYIGNNLFIHASGSRGKVAVDSIFKKLYYNNLVAIRRS